MTLRRAQGTGPAPGTRLAAIDCGTNSIRLLVAERAGDGFVELVRDLRLTRLGQGVDATGAFHPDALARTFAACDDYAAVLADQRVDALRFVATSAARDAANREVFFAGVRDRLGVEAEVIPGAEEAQLSFEGALGAAPEAEPPTLVMDIGGGSTELVLGQAGRPLRGVSLDMGSVRLRERFLFSDPPTLEELSEAGEFIDDLLDASGVDFDSARSWLGVGGTATSLSAIVQGMATYDRSRVHGSTVTRAQLADVAQHLLGMTVAEVLEIPTMVSGRADVICAGALICHRIAARLGVDLTVSESDILDGIIAGLLRDTQPAAS